MSEPQRTDIWFDSWSEPFTIEEVRAFVAKRPESAQEFHLPGGRVTYADYTRMTSHLAATQSNSSEVAPSKTASPKNPRPEVQRTITTENSGMAKKQMARFRVMRGGEMFSVIAEESDSGDLQFFEKEAWDVRWYPHVPAEEEIEFARRLITCGGDDWQQLNLHN